MHVIDLTHPIEAAMPVFPGTEPPVLLSANTIEKDGFAETLLSFYSHTGTHMDAPAHIFAGAATLDDFAAGQFIGKALVLDCIGVTEIDLDILHSAGPALEKAEFLLFYTGWAEKWGTPAYFEGFPCLSADAADYIVAAGKKGVGLDTISADPIAGCGLPIHRKLLSSGKTLIIENLTNLNKIQCSGLFTFCALPLKFAGADGAPARAIAMFD